jgi:hypothetical protein
MPEERPQNAQKRTQEAQEINLRADFLCLLSPCFVLFVDRSPSLGEAGKRITGS